MNMLQSDDLKIHPFSVTIQTARGPIPTCVCDAEDRLRRVRESNNPAWLQQVIDYPSYIQSAVKKAAQIRLKKLSQIPSVPSV
jgi:hypothetical protein